MYKKVNVSIKAKAVKQVPYSLSNSFGFLEAEFMNDPNNIPVPKDPKPIGKEAPRNNKILADRTIIILLCIHYVYF